MSVYVLNKNTRVNIKELLKKRTHLANKSPYFVAKINLYELSPCSMLLRCQVDRGKGLPFKLFKFDRSPFLYFLEQMNHFVVGFVIFSLQNVDTT